MALERFGRLIFATIRKSLGLKGLNWNETKLCRFIHLFKKTVKSQYHKHIN